MRTAFAVLLMLVFLGATVLSVGFFAVAQSAIHEIEGLICALIAAVALAALFLGTGQESVIDELARRERSTDTESA